MQIEIVQEEKEFLIVNKPTDIQIHNSRESLGLISIIRNQYNDPALYPVHRLDKITSGLLIIAKGEVANQKLSLLFQSKRIKKIYFAIAVGKPKKKQGTVSGDMALSRDGCWKLLRTKENPSMTQFHSFGLGNGCRAYLVKPITGKTHQIRVALKSQSAPILGDVRYGGRASDRAYLHSMGLKFELDDNQYTYALAPNSGDEFRSEAVLSVLSSIGDPFKFNWPDSR